MNNYSYDQYLEQWDDNFGDSDCGDFVYWQYGQRKIKILPKMSKVEFQQTLNDFDVFALEIDGLQKRHDYVTNDEIGQRVDVLMGESFQCELPLFF